MISFKNRRFRLFVLLCFLSTIAFAEELVTVVHVFDGDTIRLADKRRIRLLGINAPEVAHEGRNGNSPKTELFGEEAKKYLERMLLHQKIILELDHEKSDHYHRILAYVFLPDGTFINEKIVEQGLAYCLHKNPNQRYEKRLLRAQQTAMNSGKGIWPFLIGQPDFAYIGNQKSKRFHNPDCSSGKHTHPKNKIFFNRIRDAFYHGYAPCKQCIMMP